MFVSLLVDHAQIYLLWLLMYSYHSCFIIMLYLKYFWFLEPKDKWSELWDPLKNVKYSHQGNSIERVHIHENHVTRPRFAFHHVHIFSYRWLEILYCTSKVTVVVEQSGYYAMGSNTIRSTYLSIIDANFCLVLVIGIILKCLFQLI